MTDLKPGPEMDTLVAEKVMGWRYHKLPPPTDYGPSNRGYWYEGESFSVDAIKANDSGGRPMLKWNQPWSPSTSIAAAWEVVEKLIAPDGKGFGMYAGGDGWVAEFERALEGDSTTAPHAICLAALRACGAIE